MPMIPDDISSALSNFDASLSNEEILEKIRVWWEQEKQGEDLQSGAIDEYIDPVDASLLMLAANYGRNDICRYLVNDCCSNPNTMNQIGYTPLMYAAQNGQFETVKLLVKELRADPNKIGTVQHTAFFLSARSGHLDICDYLFREAKATLKPAEVTLALNHMQYFIGDAALKPRIIEYLVEVQKYVENRNALEPGAKALLFATHRRLGADSLVQSLPEDVLRHIVDKGLGEKPKP